MEEVGVELRVWRVAVVSGVLLVTRRVGRWLVLVVVVCCWC